MKYLILFSLLFIVCNAHAQKYSPYQKENMQIAASFSRRYNISIRHLLSVAEVNTDGGRNEYEQIKNPFKIKCYSQRCKIGHCVNIDKANHKVFYRIFPNIFESYEQYCKMKMFRRDE